MSVERLIPNFTLAEESTLTDYWLLVAHNIENSFLEAGMVPNEDYTARDLFKLAQPFVLTKWQDDQLAVVFPNGIVK